MSPRHYAKFGLPPLKKVADHFRDRHGLRVIAHNCGKVDHLIEQIADELRPDEYWGFSYLTDKRLIERCMAGRTVLSGGINPVTIFDGSPDQVKREAREAIEIFAPHKGYILMDGNNIAPGSPIENINAMHEAAEEFGRYRS
jgi:uroporphyrinogen decarboxylase